MKKGRILVLTATIPLLLFLNSFQVFRFDTRLEEVQKLEDLQRELLEENKRVLMSIEVLSSPARIDSLVSDLQDVERRSNAPRVHITIGEEGDGSARN